jgi:hypothetical protein
LLRENERLTKENIDRLLQKGKLEDEIQRLRSSPTVAETDALIARLRLGVTKGHEPSDEDAIEAAEALHRLARNQMSTDYANLARVTALQTQEADAAMREANHQQQRAEALDYKCTQFTEALLKGMTLVDELLRENGRLCAASGDPPSVRLFAAKAAWDVAMHRLLGDVGDDATESETTLSLTTTTEGEKRDE